MAVRKRCLSSGHRRCPMSHHLCRRHGTWRGTIPFRRLKIIKIRITWTRIRFHYHLGIDRSKTLQPKSSLPRHQRKHPLIIPGGGVTRTLAKMAVTTPPLEDQVDGSLQYAGSSVAGTSVQEGCSSEIDLCQQVWNISTMSIIKFERNVKS